MKKQNLEIFYETKQQAKPLLEAYYKQFDRYAGYLEKQESDSVTYNMYLCACIEGLLEAQNKQNTNAIVMQQNLKPYIKNLEKQLDMKTLYKQRATLDYEKFIGASFWEVFMAFVVVQFFQNFLTGNYLLSFSIDIAIAILCFYVMLYQFRQKLRILQRYHMNQSVLFVDGVAFGFSLFVKVIAPTPFDVSFLFLVIAYFVNKKKVTPLFENISESR